MEYEIKHLMIKKKYFLETRFDLDSIKMFNHNLFNIVNNLYISFLYILWKVLMCH